MSEVLVATFNAYVVYKIPEDLNLKDENISGYEIVDDHLIIRYKDGSGRDIHLEELHVSEPNYHYTEKVEIESAAVWGIEDDEEEEEEEEHLCKTCGEVMSDERFQEGKMCCDKPLFHDDEDEEDK